MEVLHSVILNPTFQYIRKIFPIYKYRRLLTFPPDLESDFWKTPIQQNTPALYINRDEVHVALFMFVDVSAKDG